MGEKKINMEHATVCDKIVVECKEYLLLGIAAIQIVQDLVSSFI